MILKNGSKGDEVKKLQEKLGVEAIGTFGPKTEAAVKAWQKANGLKDDGIVVQLHGLSYLVSLHLLPLRLKKVW